MLLSLQSSTEIQALLSVLVISSLQSKGGDDNSKTRNQQYDSSGNSYVLRFIFFNNSINDFSTISKSSVDAICQCHEAVQYHEKRGGLDIPLELPDELQCCNRDGMNSAKMKDYMLEDNKNQMKTRALLLSTREGGVCLPTDQQRRQSHEKKMRF